MATLYSRRFLAAAGLSGTGPSVIVPAGRVYVVKQITTYQNPSLGLSEAFLEDDQTGAALFAAAATIGTPLWAGFYGAIVFEAGQGFHFQVNASPGDAADVYCGGYDLSSP